MRASDLINLLSMVPEMEIVVGDPSTGVFRDPVVDLSRVSTYWRVVEESPGAGVPSIIYFDRSDPAQDKASGSSEESGIKEIRALNILG